MEPTLHELLLDTLKTQSIDSLTEIFEENYAIDIALTLEEFSSEDLSRFCQLAVDQQISAIIEEGDETLQKRIMSLLEPTRIVEIFSHMSTDDIADVLGVLSLDLRKELLRLMKSGDLKDVHQLMGYSPETAGGIMTTQYIALKSSLTISEALHKIKTIGPKTAPPYLARFSER